MIVLDEVRVETRIGKRGFVEQLEKEAALVPKDAGRDQQNTGQFCLPDFEPRR